MLSSSMSGPSSLDGPTPTAHGRSGRLAIPFNGRSAALPHQEGVYRQPTTARDQARQSHRDEGEVRFVAVTLPRRE